MLRKACGMYCAVCIRSCCFVARVSTVWSAAMSEHAHSVDPLRCVGRHVVSASRLGLLDLWRHYRTDKQPQRHIQPQLIRWWGGAAADAMPRAATALSSCCCCTAGQGTFIHQSRLVRLKVACIAMFVPALQVNKRPLSKQTEQASMSWSIRFHSIPFQHVQSLTGTRAGTLACDLLAMQAARE
jgi:hypothetical protein